MFFFNTIRRKRILNKIQYIFSSAYQSQLKMKIGKHVIPLIFPKYQLAVIFDCAEDSAKKKIELEKLGVKVFVIGDKESILDITSRLIYILFNLEKSYVTSK